MDLDTLAAEFYRLRDWKHSELPRIVAEIQNDIGDLQKSVAVHEQTIQLLVGLHQKADRLDVDVSGIIPMVKRHEEMIRGNGKKGLQQEIGEIHSSIALLAKSISSFARVGWLLVGLFVTALGGAFFKLVLK